MFSCVGGKDKCFPFLFRVKGVSLLAFFILVGITIVLGVAMTVWVWSTALQAIYSYQDIGYIKVDNLVIVNGKPVLFLHVDNRFAWSTIHIIRVDIFTSEFGFVNESLWVVNSGENKMIIVSSWKSWGNTSLLKPGVKVRVLIYTAERGPIWFDVVAEEASS